MTGEIKQEELFFRKCAIFLILQLLMITKTKRSEEKINLVRVIRLQDIE